MQGFYRIAVASPTVSVGNISANAEAIIAMYQEAVDSGAAVVCFPELSLTGYSCDALFCLPHFISTAADGLATVMAATKRSKALMIVGLPVMDGSRLYDAAAVVQSGKLLGVVAKNYPQCFRGIDEARYFSACDDNAPVEISLCGSVVPFGDDLLFTDGKFAFGVEIGSDRTCVIPTSSYLAIGGATVVFNPSAEAAVAGDNSRRCTAICSLSKTLHAIYASAGVNCSESTGTVVFSGHGIIAEDGKCLENAPQCERGGTLVCTEVNPAWMSFIRRNNSNFNVMSGAQELRQVAIKTLSQCDELEYREFSPQPFVPENSDDCCALCDDLLRMQSAALAKRLQSSHAQRMVIGLSGGLDSTIALLACVECCDSMGWPRDRVCAVTMPGMGTSSRTRNNAGDLAQALGCEFREVPISNAIKQHFADIGHDPANTNVVYENSQARERTQILLDIANGINGIVVGTGDLSEIALGWCTFNGDHIANYGVNGGIPKTLLRAEATYYATWAMNVPKIKSGKKIAQTLMDIVNTPISPELLPGAQQTEKIIGDYALHDFFLYYFMQYGEGPENLAELALYAFNGDYDETTVQGALGTFIRRFFTSQFKRNCAPECARTTAVSLDAHGSWNMPSDLDASAFLQK